MIIHHLTFLSYDLFRAFFYFFYEEDTSRLISFRNSGQLEASIELKELFEKIKLSERIRNELIQIAQARKNALQIKTLQESDAISHSMQQMFKTIEDEIGLFIQLSNEKERLIMKQVQALFTDYWKIIQYKLSLSIGNDSAPTPSVDIVDSSEEKNMYQKVLTALLGLIEHNNESLNRIMKITPLQNALKRIHYATTIRSELITIQLFEKETILEERDDAMQQNQGLIMILRKHIEDELDEYEKMISESEGKNLKIFKNAYWEYLKHHEMVMELAVQNSKNKAFQLSKSNGRKKHDEATNLLSEIVSSNEKDMAQDVIISDNNYKQARFIQITILVVALLFGLIIAFWLTQSITKPVNKAVSVAKAIAEGDLSQRLNMSSMDEIGILSDHLDEMSNHLSNMIQQIQRHSITMSSASEELSAISSQLASGSEQMSSQSNNVAIATEQMSNNIHMIASSVEETSTKVDSVSKTAVQMSQRMNTIASAVEEMATSMNEIGSNSKEGTKIASLAIDIAGKGTSAMSTLGKAATKIGEVTGVIKQIAEQTNLLALNATIEAASAGDAGRGFAVVANEIKDLANQSAKAAEDIAKRIEGIQQNTQDAVNVINEVSTIINKINDSVNMITLSVEEQTRTNNEIASNVSETNVETQEIASSISEIAHDTKDMAKNSSEAALGVKDVSKNIQSVNIAANEASKSSQQVNISAKDLAKVAEELQFLTQRFKVKE